MTETDMPIFSRTYIAQAVTQARAIDRRAGTDLALQRVADLTHLPVDTVAEIARDEAHDEALKQRDQQCRGCGACTNQCGRREMADIPAEAVPY